MHSALQGGRSAILGGLALLALGCAANSSAAFARQEPPPDYSDAPPDAAGPPGAPRYSGGTPARFAAANTTGDGRLTFAQARAAGWTLVVRHFAEIDQQHKGYVTRYDLRTFHRRMMAERQGQPPGPPQGAPPQ